MKNRLDISNSLNQDSILQRYLDLPKFLSLLQSNSLFLSKMSKFEDQLEGGLTANDYLTTTDDAPILDLALNGLFPVHNEPPSTRQARLAECAVIETAISSSEFPTPFGNYPRSQANTLFPRCREWLYVNCWHQSDNECAAMWPLYGGKNSICIFTTAKQIQEQITVPQELTKAILSPVRYINHDAASFDDKQHGPFTSKSLPYIYEREVRLTAWNPNINLNTEKENPGAGAVAKISDLGKLINHIVVSPKSDAWFKESIERLCRDYHLDVEILDSSLKRKPPTSIYDVLVHIQTPNS
jgi:hypothetical protein